MAKKSTFKAEIIKEIGKLVHSDTQETRVLLVRDPESGIKVSCQKWWRTNSEEEWNAGKGFFLNGRDAYELGKLLQEVGNDIIHVR